MISDKAKLRRCEDDLNLGGTAIIFMGAWNIVKIIANVYLEFKILLDIDFDDPLEFAIGMTLFVVIMFFLAALVMSVHLYIGLNAAKTARGEKCSKGYFAATIISMILTVLGIRSYIGRILSLDSADTAISSLLVDLTTIYLHFVIIVSSVKIKKMRD